MLTHTVTATNWATASSNKIHSDEVARRYGFRGGLVPGVTLYGYLMNPVVAQWDDDWLSTGWADVRFVSPAYDGDTVTASIDDGQLELRDSAGNVCAAGSAGVAAPPPVLDIPAVPLPATRPPASEASLAPGTVLGAIEHRFHADKAGDYLSMVAEDLPLYADKGFAHPGWLLLDANDVLVGNVVLGPWIHVGSRAHYLSPVTDGQLVSTRAQVAECYERKGHRFVSLDVVTLADGAPAMTVRHTAIWQVREVD